MDDKVDFMASEIMSMSDSELEAFIDSIKAEVDAEIDLENKSLRKE